MQTLAVDERSAVPAELQGWNWGAFLLSVIWGLAHRCYFALFAFVPFFGLLVPFVLGAKGNEWAWRNGSWTSVAQFQDTQKRWARYALLAYAAVAVGAVAIVFLVFMLLKQSDVYKLAASHIASDARAVALLGTPIETGLAEGETKATGDSGEAQIDFDVTGPRARGHAYVVAQKRGGQWRLESMTLRLTDGRSAELVERPLKLRPLVGDTDVRGALSTQQVDARLSVQVPQLAPCFAQASSPARIQALRLAIAANGSVEQATLIGPDTDDACLEACVQKLAQNWTFPAPSDGAPAVARHGFMIE